MYSIGFPRMFKHTRTILYENHAAIKSNLLLLLASAKTTLFGDPYFGTDLLQVLFEQNDSTIIEDLVVDEIYTSIIIFMPQLYLRREDIKIEVRGIDVYATVRCTYYLDRESDLYEINLTNDSGTTV